MSLCNIVFANYTISGAVQSEDGDPIKKGLITLVKESNGEEFDKTKVSGKENLNLRRLAAVNILLNLLGTKLNQNLYQLWMMMLRIL